MGDGVGRMNFQSILESSKPKRSDTRSCYMYCRCGCSGMSLSGQSFSSSSFTHVHNTIISVIPEMRNIYRFIILHTRATPCSHTPYVLNTTSPVPSHKCLYFLVHRNSILSSQGFAALQPWRGLTVLDPRFGLRNTPPFLRHIYSVDKYHLTGRLTSHNRQSCR